LPIVFITGIGLTVLASINFNEFLTQSKFIGIGLIAFFIFSRIPYLIHLHLVKFYSLAGVIFLLLPFIFGTLTRGSIRWIEFSGLTIQPSELIKPFFILVASAWLFFRHWLWSYFLIFLLPAGLIYKQPDLGSALVIGAIWLGILINSKISFKWILLLIFFVGLFSPFAWHQLKPYQRQRLASFLDPYTDVKNSGYHQIQSVIAIGSGGIFGRGLGRGTQSQLKFLPERHTDFVFASLAEEFGLVGCLVLILSYYFLLKRLIQLINLCQNEFGCLVLSGVFSLIFFQLVVNIGMNLGLLPITGITLPFVSAGGSSFLALSISLGISHNISCSCRTNLPLAIS